MRKRLAVVADVHGNHPALEAVAADIGTRGVDAVIDCGDLVSGPLWPGETLALVRRLGWPVVRGNHDRCVGLAPVSTLSRTDRFAAEAVGEDGRRWLAARPAALAPLPGVLATHASPGDDERYLLEEVEGGRLRPAPDEKVAARLAGVGAAIVLVGHSHQSALRQLPGGTVVINPGSVGCPAYHDPSPPEHVSETGAPHARYAVLTLEMSGEGPALVAAEFVALAYDHCGAARRARALDRPDWAHALEHGVAGPPA